MGSAIVPGSFEDVEDEEDISATPPCDSDPEKEKERPSKPEVAVLEDF